MYSKTNENALHYMRDKSIGWIHSFRSHNWLSMCHFSISFLFLCLHAYIQILTKL